MSDDDELPPCIGEAYREVLEDIRYQLIDPANIDQYQETAQ